MVCDAAMLVEDICNGVDDNCNGQMDEVVVACSEINDFGICFGSMECAGGVVFCMAVVSVVEFCNKLDDDCDGVIDEEICADGLECIDDICQDDGGCSNFVLLGACLIEGSCYLVVELSSVDVCF